MKRNHSLQNKNRRNPTSLTGCVFLLWTLPRAKNCSPALNFCTSVPTGAALSSPFPPGGRNKRGDTPRGYPLFYLAKMGLNDTMHPLASKRERPGEFYKSEKVIFLRYLLSPRRFHPLFQPIQLCINKLFTNAVNSVDFQDRCLQLKMPDRNPSR